MSTPEIPEWLRATGVSADITDIVAYIHEIRNDLTNFHPDHAGGAHVTSAREELGAVVVATEDAANIIMDACDTLSKAINDENATDVQINAAINKIYMACSFQDLTSQRVTKVQRTLEVIEKRLSDVAIKLGVDPAIALETSRSSKSENDDQKLLNGPALNGVGVAQDDIDSLFG